MSLRLIVENADQFGPDLEPEFELPQGRATIGRAATADWRLPDTSRFLSGVHCELVTDSHGHVLIDRSRNGVVIDGRPLVQDETVPLTGGERIVLGPFSIRVSVEGQPSRMAEPDPDKTTIAGMPPPATRPVPPSPDATQIARPAETAAPAKTAPPKAPAAKPPRPAIAPAAFSTGFIQNFAEGAGLDPDELAGRTDAEFARSLGEMMRVLVPAVAGLTRSAIQMRQLIGSRTAETREPGLFDDPNINSMRQLFGQERDDGQPVSDALEEVLADLAEHDEAVFRAMQTALFELLNSIAPDELARLAGAGFLRSRKARSWDAYRGQWDELNNAGDNGLLDAFLARFRAAYDSRILGD